jgi:hypothetical protein
MNPIINIVIELIAGALAGNAAGAGGAVLTAIAGIAKDMMKA